MQKERKADRDKRVECSNRFSTKTVLLFLFLTIGIGHMVINADAFVPVAYICCHNYTYRDGVQLDNFENKNNGGLQLDNFENLNNWTVGGTGASQQADTINVLEGSKSLKLVATFGNRAYTDKIINNNFSTTNNFVYWIYVNNASFFSYTSIYFTSTSNWSKFFVITAQGLHNGWNKILVNKNDFTNNGGESWNNVMNRTRIAIYPISGMGVNASLDNLRYDMPYDWIASGIDASQQADTINFKEGMQGLKLIATGNSAATDLVINNNFSDMNNFVIWAYVDNSSNLNNMFIYFTSTGSTWNKYFYDAVYLTAGWNKLVFNKHSFANIGGESWNNVMNRTRLRIYPSAGHNANVTFDDLRYNLTGQRAKLMIEFDDGKMSTLSNAYPILNANNQTGVAFVVTSYVGDTADGYMNLDNLRALQNAGWDISSHTVHHVYLNSVNASTLTSELNDSYNWLVNNNFQKSAGFIAYPYGAFNDEVIDNVKKRYIFGRTVMPESAQQHFTSTDDAIKYIQRSINVYNYTTVQSLKDQINDSINARLLGILVFHDIVNTYPVCTADVPCTYQYSTADLQSISNYIKSRSADIDVVTYSDYVVPNINNFSPVINKTTRIYSNGSATLVINNKHDEYMSNMTVKPLSGYVDINITAYNETGGIVKFNISNPSNSDVVYSIGDRIPNRAYKIIVYWENGTKYQEFNVLSDNTGYIKYSIPGFGTGYQEIDMTKGQVTYSSFDIIYNVS